MNARTLLALSLAAGLVTMGCEKAADATKAATDKAKDAGKAAGDATKAVADKAGDAAKAGTDAVKDAGKAVADKAGDAVAALKAEGTKWLTDTVEKQWPAAKATLADITKKAADIKDAGLKTKVEEAVKGLTGQSTEIEGLVAKLKDFKDGDYGAMFTKAKDMFSGFMKKLDEVKAMLPK